MNKIFGISLIAILTVSPLMASAAGIDPTNAISSSEPYRGIDITDADLSAAASGAYVKGAYNAAIGAINEVANTANGAVKSVVQGSTNGTISVDGTDISVHGLGSAAYTDSSAYATAAQGTTADNAVQSVKVNGTALTEDANHDVNLTIATGSTAGTIAVNGTNVAVNGVVTSLEGYATTESVNSAIDAATGSANNVSLAVSGSVTGTVSGNIPVLTRWADTTVNNIALTNGTLNNGAIANGAIATGNITGIDIAATSASSSSNNVTCPYILPSGADMPASPDSIGGCDEICSLQENGYYLWNEDNEWEFYMGPCSAI